MRNRPLMSGCLILFFLIAMCAIIGGAEFVKELRPSVLENVVEEKEYIRLSGQVYDKEEKEKYQVIYLKNNSIIYQNKSFKESKIIVYDEKKLNIGIGNQIEVYGEVSFYEAERNPGNFNRKLYYQKQGIHASVWASKINICNNTIDALQEFLYDFRMKWKELLVNVLGEEDGAILSAMILAEKAGMNEETKELYQANGIAHVLAISGLHLSVIGIGLYKLFRRMTGSFLAGGIAGMSFLLLYILMIGMSVSVLRAFIMFLFRVGADMTGRHYDSPTALSAAAVITIISNPLYLYDGGFWLSYGAITAIILILPMFREVRFQSFWASISINLATLPILLYYFFEIPVYSVILNMIVIPLMSAVLLCGLTGSVFCTVFVADGFFGMSGIGGVMLKVCKLIFYVYERMCKLSLKLPCARIVAGQPKIWQIVIYYIGLCVYIALWRRKKYLRENPKNIQKYNVDWIKRVQVLAGLFVLANTILMAIPGDKMIGLHGDEVSITVLDVGQGDGIFIKGPQGNTYLIDSGSSDVKKVGKYRLEPFLKSKGVKKIDYVFVSHGDGDHISGIEEMIDRTNVGVAIETIVFPERRVWDENLLELAQLAVGNGIRVAEISKDQELVEGDMKLRCLAPVFEADVNSESASIYHGDSNGASMVLALSFEEFDMLLTGDVEKEGEGLLTEVLSKDLQDVKWDVLKVAHHGSKNSSSEEFLNIVTPAYAVISAGRDNSYGHPHVETMERLKNVGSTVLSTQECGAIIIETDGKKMKVEGYLKKEK